MNQRKKNIRLLVILGVLTVVTLGVILTDKTGDTLDVPRGLFAFEDTESVDQVVVGKDTLTFNGSYWMVNQRYKADPQRVEVLFAILRQVQVRRKASLAQLDSLNQQMDQEGVMVRLYSAGSLVREYVVWGNPERGMTWLRETGADIPYLAEIPGYRSYLGGIFGLDENSWRYPIVLDINWQNLQGVTVSYPGKEASSFEIAYTDGFYGVKGLAKTDSSRLTDFLDNLSLLYVNDFLSAEELSPYDSLTGMPQAHIVVEDVGKNQYVVDVFEKVPGRDEILVRVDSADFGLADYGKVKTLLKPRQFFSKQ